VCSAVPDNPAVGANGIGRQLAGSQTRQAVNPAAHRTLPGAPSWGRVLATTVSLWAGRRAARLRHPRLALVIAHMGAPEYEDFLALAERYPRVCLDTTMAFTDFFEQMRPYPPALRPRLRDLGLAGQVLLGSDFPTIPYPYLHQLESLARLRDRHPALDDEWVRKVCWSNAVGLFGAPPGT